MGLLNSFEIDFKCFRMNSEILGLSVIRDDCYSLLHLFGEEEFIRNCLVLQKQENFGLFIPIFYFKDKISNEKKKMFLIICDNSKKEVLNGLLDFLKTTDMNLKDLDISERLFSGNMGKLLEENEMEMRFLDMCNLSYSRKTMEIQLRKYFDKNK